MAPASTSAKKRSMRMSIASRHSLASLMNSGAAAKSSSGSSSRAMGAFTDSRCYKHSPRVAQRRQTVGAEMFDYEAEQWFGAFSAMGGLRRMGGKAPEPFTVLNKAPYHCKGLSREFEVRYGELIKRQPPVFRKAKKAERQQICNCITKEVLPVLRDMKVTGPLNLDRPVERRLTHIKHYLPKSCVHVRWDPNTHSSVDKICEWLLSSFGPFLFTTRTASNAMLVAFESMEQAHRAVQFPMLPTSKIFIKWHNPQNYNFGHYTKDRRYLVVNDSIWRRGMEERARSRPIAHQSIDASAKSPKRLKITESV